MTCIGAQKPDRSSCFMVTKYMYLVMIAIICLVFVIYYGEEPSSSARSKTKLYMTETEPINKTDEYDEANETLIEAKALGIEKRSELAFYKFKPQEPEKFHELAEKVFTRMKRASGGDIKSPTWVKIFLPFMCILNFYVVVN